MSIVLGINTLHAGSSAVLVVDGEPVAAIAEERLNRIKYYAEFPGLAIRKCLEMGNIEFRDLDYVAIGHSPTANYPKKLKYALTRPTNLFNFARIRTARKTLSDVKQLIAKHCNVELKELRFKQVNVEHHIAHIASAYFASPWKKSAGFSMDGSGDFVSCMLADCEGDRINVKRRIYLPHSMGSFYTMICDFIGYRKYGDEGKIMGLAPYGTDTFKDIFEQIVHLDKKGFELNTKFFMPFGSTQGMVINEDGEVELSRHYSNHTIDMFGAPNEPYSTVEQRDCDLAYGAQRMFNKVYFHMLNILHDMVPCDRISMAGGSVLNSVANGMIFDKTPFKETYIQPAAGDEGLALGAALYVSRSILHENHHYVMENPYLGPEFSDKEIQQTLNKHGVKYERHDRENLLDATADGIAKGNVVGWFQGRMEWGPRALGNRSILANPSSEHMKTILNARIKRREWFRPFAPSVLADRQDEIFEHTHPSPFMLHVYKVKPQWRNRLEAVNHVDNTGRLQSVSRKENPLYYDLIHRYGEKTGVPVVLNTSFNENEPIVCSPDEAVDCFLRTKMDLLSIGPFFCTK